MCPVVRMRTPTAAAVRVDLIMTVLQSLTLNLWPFRPTHVAYGNLVAHVGDLPPSYIPHTHWFSPVFSGNSLPPSLTG